MKLAPFQLTDYYVTSLTVAANQDFDPKAESGLSLDTLTVVPRSQPDKDNPRKWIVEISITQEIPEGKNIPYRFELEMIGFVDVSPGWPEDQIAHHVGCNGPSMLFGAAREIIRAATGRGPFGPMLIPSTTFFSPPPKPPESPRVEAGGDETKTKRKPRPKQD